MHEKTRTTKKWTILYVFLWTDDVMATRHFILRHCEILQDKVSSQEIQ